MNDVKLLTPEEIEEAVEELKDRTWGAAWAWGTKRRRQVVATIIALAERLARVERCKRKHGGHKRGLALARVDGKITDCPDCNGTDNAHKDWQDALRKLGEE